MSIHVFSVVDRVPILFPLIDSDYETIGSQFTGSPISAWCPPRVRVANFPDTSVTRGLSGDCFWLWVKSDVPVVSLRARKILEPLIGNNVQFLELTVGAVTLFALNALTVADCVDYERAEVKRFSDGAIMRFAKFAFLEERVAGLHIFKIVEQPERFVFVSEEFVRVTCTHLKGFHFKDAAFAGSLKLPKPKKGGHTP